MTFLDDAYSKCSQFREYTFQHKPAQTQLYCNALGPGVSEGGCIQYDVPALRLPPVGLLVEKAKEDPPVPTPPNPGPPTKPVGESDMEVSLS